MAMDLVLPITALVLASAIEASKASHTTLARGMPMPMLMLLLMLMPMPMLMLTMVIMDMVLGLPITHTVLPAVMLAQLFMDTQAIDMDITDIPSDTSARGLLSLSPMVSLLLCTTQSVLPGTLDLPPAMLVALSLVIQVSIMAKGLLMLMLMPMLMPMLTTVCMDMEDMDTGIPE